MKATIVLLCYFISEILSHKDIDLDQSCLFHFHSDVNESNFWGTPCDVALQGLRLKEEENLTLSSINDQSVLTFLYVKEIYFDQLPVVRLAHYQHIIDPSLALPNIKSYKYYFEARERLDRLLSPQGDTFSDFVPQDVENFSTALSHLPDWKESGFVFHRDHPCASERDILVQRKQLRGLCYLHAPVVISHYLVSQHGNVAPKEMINIAAMIRSTFSSAELAEHIFSDSGDNSLKYLEKILQPGSVIESVPTANVTEAILLEYGPGLISSFKVYSDFFEENVRSYTGQPSMDFIGYHAMVLIGVRTDNAGVKTYLIQNWWPDKQFLEVSAEYLIKVGVRAIHFVLTPQMTIPRCFPTHNHLFAENMDKPERLLQER